VYAQRSWCFSGLWSAGTGWCGVVCVCVCVCVFVQGALTSQVLGGFFWGVTRRRCSAGRYKQNHVSDASSGCCDWLCVMPGRVLEYLEDASVF